MATVIGIMGESEIYKPVVGFEGVYEVSDSGVVRYCKNGKSRPLKPKLNRFTGYAHVNLYGHGSKRPPTTKTIHRIVAEAFLPNPNGYNSINHINENKLDNRACNLEWCTPQQNSMHSSYRWRKPVSLYTVDGEYVATFASCELAASFLDVEKSDISKTAKKKHETCKGFVIEYERRDK